MRRFYPLLDRIHGPADLKKLSVNQLPQLCDELRDFLVYSIGTSGGHFASNLGSVELTVALHYVYDSPYDKLIWDVGHQTYAHKVLTGRKERLHTIRSTKGLHPFPFREESEHDILTVGHSSTSISVGVGLAQALQRTGSRGRVVPIIGDGSMTAGMVFEALNHAGGAKVPMTIVFNDNNMSISPNKGAFNMHTDRIFNSRLYQSIRNKSKDVLPEPVKQLLKTTEQAFKQMVSPSIANLFTSLGVDYIGPVDGHDVVGLVETLQRHASSSKLQLIHCLTQKGKGYLPAEQDPVKYHGVGKFTPNPLDIVQYAHNPRVDYSIDYRGSTAQGYASEAEVANSAPSQDLLLANKVPYVAYAHAEQVALLRQQLAPLWQTSSELHQIANEVTPTYSQVFGSWLMQHGNDNQLVCITPAMIEGSGISQFAQAHPEKVVDVAIAEQHAVSIATGYVLGGLKPVVAIYSTFLQRAYDQLIHDVAIDNLPVIFAIDRAGVVGEDGQTHQGTFDISYLRCIPNLTIATPSSQECMTQLFTEHYTQANGPVAIRYPRGKAKTIQQIVSYLQQRVQEWTAQQAYQGTEAAELAQQVQQSLNAVQELTPRPCLSSNSAQSQLVFAHLATQGQAALTRTPKIAVLNFGDLLLQTLPAAAYLGAACYDLTYVKRAGMNWDAELDDYDYIFVVEQNAQSGGAAGVIYEHAAQRASLRGKIVSLGLSDQFVPPMSTSDIYTTLGWRDEDLAARMLASIYALQV